MKYNLLYLSLFVCFLFSCHSRPDEILKEAESLISEYPDSALQILQSIRDPHKFAGKQQADYCLLLSQAMDKNDLPLNDSLLNIALGYYKNSPDLERKAKAYFYQGRYYYELQEYEDATPAFKEAENWAVDARNEELASLVYNHLGYINNMQGHYEKALSYFKQALYFSQKLNKTERAVYNLLEIAKTFFYTQEKDSILFYNEQLKESLEQCSDETKNYVYHFLGTFYSEHNEPDKALEYLQLSLLYNNVEITPYTYTVLGDVYAKKGDSKAHLYWQKALATDSDTIRIAVYDSMFSTLLKEEKYKEAALCADSIIIIIQDAYADILDGELLRIQEHYDNDSLQIKIMNSELKLYRWILFSASTIFLLTIGFLFYRKNKKQKEAAILEKVIRKEFELAEYKFRMDNLEKEVNWNKKEKKQLLLRHSKLKEKIQTITAELAPYKKYSEKIDSKAQIEANDISAFWGMMLYSRLLHGENIALTNSDFCNIINFSCKIDSGFMAFLNSLSLSDLEKTTCILIRANISNERIATSILKVKPDSLRRSKDRIKDKMQLKKTFSFDDFVKKH